MGTTLTIKIIEGHVAPRYDTKVTKEIEIINAVVTEKGTNKHLPVVDFQMKDKMGNEYFAAITARHILCLAEVIQGINHKNHGSTNP